MITKDDILRYIDYAMQVDKNFFKSFEFSFREEIEEFLEYEKRNQD